MTDLNQDLNATIAAAVNAQVTSRVAEAMAGDEFLKTAVVAALNQEIEVQGSGYRKITTTYLNETLRRAMQSIVEKAVQQALEAERETIQQQVTIALRSRAAAIAEQFADQLVEKAQTNYGISVSVRWPER